MMGVELATPPTPGRSANSGGRRAARAGGKHAAGSHFYSSPAQGTTPCRVARAFGRMPSYLSPFGWTRMGKDRQEGLFAFVVQKHKTRSLHYDFRLEIGGVMPSWSVPKGPTLEAGVRRLAMPTGDHDLEYRHFEGRIPGGEYGAGPVMIWDEGTFTPEREVSKGKREPVTDPREAEKTAREDLREGNLKFRLFGKKLKGSFALVRAAGIGGGKEAWLLLKHADEFCEKGYDASRLDFSAVTGRPMAQIAGGAGAARRGRDASLDEFHA
jgi:DNA ligase D-like protein (predicted 3'-phosphoesterase)